MNFITETLYDDVEKTWSGPNIDYFYDPKTTMGAEICKICADIPDKVLQVTDTDGVEITASQLMRDSKILARKILSLGLKPGDIVGIYAKNTTHLCTVIVSTLLCGTPWNAIFPEFNEEFIKLTFGLTMPKLIFCDKENYETLRNALNDLNLEAHIVIVNGKLEGVESVEELLQSEVNELMETRFPGLELEGDAIAVIIFSSGTTGNPKGVMISHQTLLNSPIYSSLTSDSVVLAFSTFHWISAIWNFLSAILCSSKRIITDRPYTTEYFFQIVAKHGITHASMSTTNANQLSQEITPKSIERLRSLKMIICGGAKAPVIVCQTLHSIFASKPNTPGLFVAYGLSELGGMLTQSYKGSTECRYDTEGKMLPLNKARIIDNEAGSKLGPNETGRIYVRKPFEWPGYFKNEAATKKAVVDGWIDTGDIGFFDAEGYLIVCARESDVFKSKSFQIFPHKLEEIILQLPGVAETCIFAVPHFEFTNVIGCAVVRAKNEKGKALTAKNIIDHVRNNMIEVYRIQGGVYFLEELPRNSVGKLMRRKVYDLIKNAEINALT